MSHLKAIDRAAEILRSDDPTLLQWARNYASNHRHRLADDLEQLLERAAANVKVLEIGASPPVLTVAAKRAGVDITAVDLAPERFAAVFEAEAIPALAVDIEREPLPFRDRSVDLLLFNEVFEHLRIDLIFTVRELLRVLKPGGVLMLSTPNARSFRGLRGLLLHGRSAHIGPSVYDEYEKLTRFGHMGHVREYTETELREFLERIGFEIETSRYRFAKPLAPLARRGATAHLEAVVTRALPSLKPLLTLFARRPLSMR